MLVVYVVVVLYSQDHNQALYLSQSLLDLLVPVLAVDAVEAVDAVDVVLTPGPGVAAVFPVLGMVSMTAGWVS